MPRNGPLLDLWLQARDIQEWSRSARLYKCDTGSVSSWAKFKKCLSRIAFGRTLSALDILNRAFLSGIPRKLPRELKRL
jgi:hypothetical protein